MEIITLFDVNQRRMNGLITAGIVVFIVFIALLVLSFFSPFYETAGKFRFLFFPLACAGIFVTIAGYAWKEMTGCFIAFDDTEVRYLMWNQKKEECIRFTDIKAIDARSHSIIITLDNTDKIINLNNIKKEKQKMIREKFDDIRQKLQLNEH